MAPFARIYGDYNEYWQNFTWQKLVTCADYYGYDWGSTKAHGAWPTPWRHYIATRKYSRTIARNCMERGVVVDVRQEQ